jgi:hypothetical protein
MLMPAKRNQVRKTLADKPQAPEGAMQMRFGRATLSVSVSV